MEKILSNAVLAGVLGAHSKVTFALLKLIFLLSGTVVTFVNDKVAFESNVFTLECNFPAFPEIGNVFPTMKLSIKLYFDFV